MSAARGWPRSGTRSTNSTRGHRGCRDGRVIGLVLLPRKPNTELMREREGGRVVAPPQRTAGLSIKRNSRRKPALRGRQISESLLREQHVIRIHADSDLRIPPGNRLEALKGDRRGAFSIRINEQYRICFRWTERGARDVEIVDYHR